MKIKLNYDSWHYRFFNKLLPFTEPPKSLCPYFWTLLGLILIYPFLKIIQWFNKLFNSIPKKEISKEHIYKKMKLYSNIGEYFFKFILYVILPLLGIGLIFGFILILTETKIKLIIITLLTFIVMVLGIFVIIKLIEKTSKYFSILIKKTIKFILIPSQWCWWMIKAIYEKSCPLIEWENNETN